MSGAAIQSKVRAGLERVAQRAGTGDFTVLLIRQQDPDLTTTPPTKGAQVAYTFTGMQTRFSFAEQQAGNVQAGDVKFLLAVGTTEPRNSDKIKVNGVRYEIEAFEAVAPGGVPLMWKIHARGGVADNEAYAPGTPDPT
ncbi:MAG: hypothetical protein AAFM92_03205 [Pseudomonadota bacterium]